MPLLRIKSEKDLRGAKLRKSPKAAQAGFAAAAVPPVPPLPSHLDRPPQLPIPDFIPAHPSPKFASPGTPKSLQRRSRSVSGLVTDLSASPQDQPWRSREAWQALHSQPSSPQLLPLPNAGSSGWRGRGGGTFFGGGVGDDISSARSEGMRRVRTETRSRGGPVSEVGFGVGVGSPLAEPPQVRRSVTRSHTDGDLSSLASSTPRQTPGILGSIIDDYSPHPSLTWTTGTAGALYRQKTLTAARPALQTAEWQDAPTPPPIYRQNTPRAAIPEGDSTRTSVDSHYPPTMVSDRSTISSTEESTLLVTTESFSRTPTPPRGSVDVPTSPSQSPWMTSPERLPALLPPVAPKLGERKPSFTKIGKDESPIPWARKSPSQKGRRRSYTSPASSTSVPQTPLTPPDLYTAADVPHTPSPPQITSEWIDAATRTPLTPVRPPIAVRGSSVRPFLHSQVSSPALLPAAGLRPAAAIVSRSTSRSSFRDALPPPPIPDRASSAPRGAGAASPPRPKKSPKRKPVPAIRGRMRRVDSYGSGWSKESAASAGSGSTGDSSSRNSRGGWI